LTFTSVNYALENTRASYWVSYIDVTTNEKAYACVQYYVRVGEAAHAVIHELTLRGTDEYTAINLSIPATPRVAIVPVEQFVFKLYVLFTDDTTIRASESLHLRIDG
jgi:hypothetical protein